MSFDIAFDRTIGIEKGYVNDPADPGGETNWGISKRSYPDLDIASLTRDQAKTIYYRDFWTKLARVQAPEPVLYQLFDFAVNSGVAAAIEALQRVVGTPPDGVWGPASQAALARAHSETVPLLLLAERLQFMTSLHNWPAAGRGWARRIAKQLQFAVADLG